MNSGTPGGSPGDDAEVLLSLPPADSCTDGSRGDAVGGGGCGPAMRKPPAVPGTKPTAGTVAAATAGVDSADVDTSEKLGCVLGEERSPLLELLLGSSVERSAAGGTDPAGASAFAPRACPEACELEDEGACHVAE